MYLVFESCTSDYSIVLNPHGVVHELIVTCSNGEAGFRQRLHKYSAIFYTCVHVCVCVCLRACAFIYYAECTRTQAQ